MTTHVLRTFSKEIFPLNKQQAEYIQDILANGLKNDKQKHFSLQGSSIHVGSIEGVYTLEQVPDIAEQLAEQERITQATQLQQLPEPKNRYTREQNIQRMRDAAIEAKKSEQAKYGLQKWSTPVEEWMK